MRLLALVAVPAAAALVAIVVPVAPARLTILLAIAAAHLVTVISLWVAPSAPALGEWIAADALGLVVLTVVSALFLVVASYAIGYLRRGRPRGGRAFVSCLLAFLATASLVSTSHHLALLWVGMEGTTLAVAPLIFHRHDRRSLEAVWKYLVLSSVGIALALLGVFLLATAQPTGAGRPLLLGDLVANARALDGAWLRAAFVFLLVGFGTKMGLAPLHTWKPDTYGEAPSLVAGLMAGGLTSCAFLGVARITQVIAGAGLADFARPLLLAFGLASLIVAAVFMIAQRDARRLLGYSSVEHMGLLVLGLGLGGLGPYGAVLHLVNNALAKGLLFLAVGNVVLVTGSATVAPDGRGLLHRLPATGTLLLVGLFAVTGSPPFGLFVSEFTILSAAVGQGHPWVAALIVILLVIIFVGIARLILALCFGEVGITEGARGVSGRAGNHHASPAGGIAPASASAANGRGESMWLVAGPAALAVIVLALGLYIPAGLHRALGAAAASLGGGVP
jgi:hydrogenase-4 component F